MFRVKPVFVVADTGKNVVGAKASCRVFDIRLAPELHEIAGMNHLKLFQAGMMHGLVEIVLAEFPSVARTRFGEFIEGVSIAAVDPRQMRI